jgi:hypothetical protein
VKPHATVMSLIKPDITKMMWKTLKCANNTNSKIHDTPIIKKHQD